MENRDREQGRKPLSAWSSEKIPIMCHFVRLLLCKHSLVVMFSMPMYECLPTIYLSTAEAKSWKYRRCDEPLLLFLSFCFVREEKILKKKKRRRFDLMENQSITGNKEKYLSNVSSQYKVVIYRDL